MSDNKQSITVVVNGAAVEVTANPNAALVALIEEALRTSQNTGQPPDNWDLKDAAGQVIDPHRKLRDLGLPAGAKLYLSVKAGVGGNGEAFADPAVSRAKFDREVADYRTLDADHRKRGWFLLRAEFPVVEVLFTASQLSPPSALFIAVLDFSDYDFLPPSVRIVDPFTGKAFNKRDLDRRVMFLQHRDAGAIGPPGMRLLQSQPLMMAYSEDQVPFFCLPGVREYHAQPAHSGDSWLLHRLTGEGTLFNILEKLHASSIGELSGYRFGLQIVGYTRAEGHP